MKKALKIVFLFCVISIGFSQEDNANIITIKNLENEIKEDKGEVQSFNIIEQVPVYKDCNEKLDSYDLRECMSTAINKHVLKYYNTNITAGLGLEGSKVKIYCRFTIDKDGSIINIEARGPHPKLEQEAKRVIELMPIFDKPGMQDKKPVKVTFDLPITFNMQKKKPSKTNRTTINNLDSFPVHKRCDETLGLNSQRECTKKRIIDFVKLSLNMELLDKLFPLDKSTKFQLDFIIDKKGRIKNITAKAHHIKMAAEAIRVAKRLPKLKAPGFKNGKPTEVPFSILMTVYF